LDATTPSWTDVVVERDRVVEFWERLAGDEHSGREPAAEEILRHLAVARSPEWPRALDRAGGEIGSDADAEGEGRIEMVLEIPKSSVCCVVGNDQSEML
jgi:hypothetical protein